MDSMQPNWVSRVHELWVSVIEQELIQEAPIRLGAKNMNPQTLESYGMAYQPPGQPNTFLDDATAVTTQLKMSSTRWGRSNRHWNMFWINSIMRKTIRTA
jgi:hypothetical protein